MSTITMNGLIATAQSAANTFGKSGVASQQTPQGTRAWMICGGWGTL